LSARAGRREHNKERKRQHNREPRKQEKAFGAILSELLTLDVGSGFTLRRTAHDLAQLRSPSRRLWLLYFRRLGLPLAFDTRVLLAILRLNSFSLVIGLHRPNLLENC